MLSDPTHRRSLEELDPLRQGVDGWGPGAGGGAGESVFHGDRASVWGDGKVLEVDGGDGCTTM